MSSQPLRLRGLLSLASVLALSGAFSVVGGCAMQASEPVEEGASTDDITQVDHTKVKRQSIGNCWLYATSSWLEALNKMATGTEANTSESYVTYWDWFEKIGSGRTGTEVSTGGSWGTAVELIVRYGLMMEKDFIADEAESEMSNRQSSALSAINESLKNGALKDPAARRDRALVRRELDKAWRLSPEVVTALDAVFGASVTKTLDKSYASRKPVSTSKVLRAKDFPAKLKDPVGGQWKVGTLADAIGTRSWDGRTGALAWNEVDYPYDVASRRSFEIRVQKALHDGQPVIISWFVDFNAMSRQGSFTLEELKSRGGPGRQGGHMTVLNDYEVTNVPTFGTLKAGVLEKRPEALAAALDPKATITFFRIKNSWGAYRPDRWDEASIPGYHDLYNTYLRGPVKKCAETASGGTDTTNCSDTTPLWDVVLPKGY